MPQTLFEWMRFLSGPLIGALIGYLTNWLAVKMLFRPRKALYIGKLHIPFTPGVIPRRKAALATALGKMVSEMLVRKEDLKESLCSKSVSRTVAKTVLSLPGVKEVGLQVFDEEKYEAGRDKLLDFATDRILQGLISLDLGAIISHEAMETVNTFTASNPLLKMFVSDQLITTLTETFQTIAITVDFETETMTAYLNGVEVASTNLAIPAVTATSENKAETGLEWLETIGSYIVNWYCSSCSGNTDDRALLIDNIKIRVDAPLPPGENVEGDGGGYEE